MKSPKPYIIFALAIIMFVGIMVLQYRMVNEVKKPEIGKDSFTFREALWSQWGVAVVVVALIILAGGLGILVLLGGDWRWE